MPRIINYAFTLIPTVLRFSLACALDAFCDEEDDAVITGGGTEPGGGGVKGFLPF